MARGHDHEAELAAIRPFIREQHPVLVGVGAGADLLRKAGFTPDVIVVDALAEDADLPAAKTLRAARDVVVRIDRGAHRDALDQLERVGVRPLRFESAATPEDAGLLLADAARRRGDRRRRDAARPSTTSWTGSAPAWPAPT